MKRKCLFVLTAVMLVTFLAGCSKKETTSGKGEAIKGEVVAENQVSQEEQGEEEPAEKTEEAAGNTEDPVEESTEPVGEAVSDNEDVNSETHYENEYFSIDVPESWIGNWSISATENTMQADNPRVVAAYSAGYNDVQYGGGGGAIIHVLKIEDGDRLGYGYFSMSGDVICVNEKASSEYFTFIMTQAGAGFFHEGGATITAKE